MVVSVFGTVNSSEIIFRKVNDGTVWEATVPSNLKGQYIVELYAKDGAGNTAYFATVIIKINPETLSFTLEFIDYSEEALLSGFFALEKMKYTFQERIRLYNAEVVSFEIV